MLTIPGKATEAADPMLLAYMLPLVLRPVMDPYMLPDMLKPEGSSFAGRRSSPTSKRTVEPSSIDLRTIKKSAVKKCSENDLEKCYECSRKNMHEFH